MARLQVTIEGSAKGLSQAFSQASNSVASATNKINKDLKVSKQDIEAWDAAARKAASSRYAGGNFVSPALAERAASNLKSIRVAQDQLTRSTQNYGRIQGSTNGVAVEFSRIIQDAPYGIHGVANNIQQLSQSLAYASKGAGGFGNALKASFASLLSPMNLVVLGISAVTAGWTLYQKYARKAKDETDDVKQSFEDFVATLDAVKGAQALGEADAQKQITRLKILYSTTQDATMAMDTRKKAVRDLQKEFPSYFGGLKTEAILAGEAKGAYEQLTTAILATAQARAAADKIAEGAKEQLKNRLQIEQQQELLNQANERIRIAKQEAAIYEAAGQSATALAVVSRAEKERNEIAAQINEKAITNNNINETNKRLIREINGLIKEGASATLQFSDTLDTVSGSLKKVQGVASNALSPFEQSLRNSIDQLRELHVELDKIYGTKGFDPFDQSEVFRRGTQATPDSGGVSYFQQAESEWAQKGKKDVDDFSRTMSHAINRAGRDFYRTMLNLGSLSDATFGGIFATITSGMNESMQEVFLGSMSDLLKKGIAEGTEGFGGRLGSQLNIALAGVGLIGGIVSGLGSDDKPNYGAKIAGGALQGAAAGAMIGGPIGAAIGGVVGAIGGLFSGRKREKELELQEKQLREQEKQTKLMERQNSLAFLGNVVGRYIEGRGVLQSLDFTSTGQLTARIDGEDVVLSYDRTKAKQERGR